MIIHKSCWTTDYDDAATVKHHQSVSHVIQSKDINLAFHIPVYAQTNNVVFYGVDRPFSTLTCM